MIWILYIAGALVGLVVVIALIGLALPRDHVASRTARFERIAIGTVWAALTDLDRQPTWRRGLRSIERVGDARFREHTSQGTILFEVTENVAPSLRITRIADDTLPFGGRWIYELAEDRSGTRLTITEDGFVKNPVFRFLSKTVFSQTATIERFLADLAAHLGTTVTVKPAEPSRYAAR
ncbi:MAG TPA: SRPBCC family protein [Kofleriaceae bacterium]|nr:SRPBCC family protein [Kofleriaceae bacterium]